jgi:hypothetical protein
MSLFIQTREELLRNISKSIVKQIQNSDSRVTNVTEIRHLCETTTNSHVNYCKKCLETVFSSKELEGGKYVENRPLIDKIRYGVCSGSCLCYISNIDASSVMILKNLGSVSPTDFDIDKIVKEVYEATEKKSKDFNSNDTDFMTKLTDLTSNIVAKSSIFIEHFLQSQQVLSFKGTGVKIDSVSTDLFIDAIMRSIASSSENLDMADSIVNKQISWMLQSIDKNVKGGFSKVWEENRKWFIITGVIFLFLTTLIFILLIVKSKIQST